MTRKTPIITDYWESEISDMNIEINSYITEAAEVIPTYHFNKELVDRYIEPVLKKKSVQNDIIYFVGRYMDRYNRQLSARAPMHQMTFNESDRNFFYDLFGLSDDILLDISKEMFRLSGKDISYFGVIKKGPYRVLFAAMIVYALRNDLEDIITCMEYMYGFVEYPLLFSKYFRIGVMEEVMSYTVEHLPESFKIKKLNNVQEFVKYDVNSSLNFWAENLKIGVDDHYIVFINRIRTQMNSSFKNLAEVYYKNHANNNTMNTKSSTLDDGELADQEGQIAIVSKHVNSICSKMVTTGIVGQLVEISAQQAGVDKNILNNLIAQILAIKENNMPRMIECILASYFTKFQTSTILSSEFVAFGLSLYRSIGTSRDPLYMDIKACMVNWVSLIGLKQMYSREATVIAYTKAIFNYIIWTINYHK